MVSVAKSGVKCCGGNYRANGALISREALDGDSQTHSDSQVQGMTEKSLKVDRAKFEGIVKSLLKNPHIKREDVKVSKKKPEKLIPPQK